MRARAAALAWMIAASGAPGVAAADEHPPVLTLHGEGSAQTMWTETYRDRFGWGAGGTLRAGLTIAGPLAIQASVGTAWFPVAGDDPGNLYALELGARGFFRVGEAVGGPWIDANAGAGITGSLVRVVFDLGLGWDFFPAPVLGVGPMVRYSRIVQPDDQLVADDASILIVGVSVTLRLGLGSTPAPVVIERPVAPPAPGDEDGDGVDDQADRCRDVAEDVDGNADGDGCPDEDDDSDGIPDTSDRCRNAAETRNGFEDEDGCPDEAPQRPPGRERGEELPETVLFRVGTDRVSPRFADAIRSVCRTVEARGPEARIRVVGHADEQGTAAGNHRLGAARAGAVAEQLVLCGVDPQRIESTSYGDTRPACTTQDDACREANRRVGFEILTPRPTATP